MVICMYLSIIISYFLYLVVSLFIMSQEFKPVLNMREDNQKGLSFLYT